MATTRASSNSPESMLAAVTDKAIEKYNQRQVDQMLDNLAERLSRDDTVIFSESRTPATMLD